MKIGKNIFYTVVSFALFLLLWQVAVWVFDFNPSLFPPPLDVFVALGEMFADGLMVVDIAVSLYRFAVGYLSAVVVGVFLGLIMGWSRPVFKLTNPLVQLLRPIAPVAWMPFVVMLLGIGDIPAIVIIFLAGFFPILLTTASAVHHIDPIYLKVARNYGISSTRTLYKIVVPAVFPQIASSLHIALGTSWIFLVSGEMMGTQSGLGYLIIDARNNLRTDQLLATMIVIGVIGFVLDLLIGRLETKVRRMWGEVNQ